MSGELPGSQEVAAVSHGGDQSRPSFPPLFSGLAVSGRTDPLAVACAEAGKGCEAGLVVYNLQADRLRAAVVFAPDVPLAQAMQILPVCGVGFQNALGALAPPEVGVHLDWAGDIRVNGATCGHLSAVVSDADPDAVPDWLVIGLSLAVMSIGHAPGETPDRTSLHDEGCAEVDPAHLLEAWMRHSLVWINRWTDEGTGPIHREWSGLADKLNETVTVGALTGTFAGLDEHLGMLLRDGEGRMHLLPLTTLPETMT